MLEMIDELLENSLLGSVLFGIAIAVAIATGIMAIASFVLVFYSAWWLILFVLFTIVCGASIGLTAYLYDELYC
jgi:hypothetical protein